MHRLIVHMKSIKLHPAATTDYKRLSENSNIKGRSIKWKAVLMKLLIILCLAVVSGITIMAFLSNEVLFESLLAGLFIIGCVLFIKGVNNENTNIQRIKRNTNH